jgi:TonB family protein
MKNIIVIMLILFAGCCGGRQTVIPEDTPDVISMTSLPPQGAGLHDVPLRLNVYFHLLTDGSVADVNLQSTSGDPVWDAAAIDSMKQWRFTPLAPGSPSGGRWIRRTILVQIQEPIVLTLGELVVDSKEEADSLYAQLRRGVNFFTLAKRTEEGETTEIGRFIGDVDIARFPEQVRSEVRKLRVNSFTQPIRVGNMYVIYQRFENHSVQIFVE